MAASLQSGIRAIGGFFFLGPPVGPSIFHVDTVGPTKSYEGLLLREIGPTACSEVQTSFSGLAQRRFGPPSHAAVRVAPVD